MNCYILTSSLNKGKKNLEVLVVYYTHSSS